MSRVTGHELYVCSVKDNMKRVLGICNGKHAGKCLMREGGGRYPSETAVKETEEGVHVCMFVRRDVKNVV